MTIIWPDLSADIKAERQARKELGPDAEWTAVIQRAQEIKQELKKTNA